MASIITIGHVHAKICGADDEVREIEQLVLESLPVTSRAHRGEFNRAVELRRGMGADRPRRETIDGPGSETRKGIAASARFRIRSITIKRQSAAPERGWTARSALHRQLQRFGQGAGGGDHGQGAGPLANVVPRSFASHKRTALISRRARTTFGLRRMLSYCDTSWGRARATEYATLSLDRAGETFRRVEN